MSIIGSIDCDCRDRVSFGASRGRAILSGEQSQANPEQAGRQLEGVIQVEAGDRRPTCWGRALDFARLDIDIEMFRPALSARMEQGNLFPAKFVESDESVAFAQIASAASQT